MVSYEQKINDLETVLMAMHELGQKYYSEMVRLQGRITELEKSNKELEGKLKDAKSDYESQIRQKENDNLKSLNTIRESYQGEAHSLRSVNDKMVRHLDTLGKVIRELESKRKELEKKEEKLKYNIDTFETKKKDWDEEKENIIKQRNYYKEEYERLKNAQQEQNEVKKEESIDTHQEQDAEGKARAQEGDNSSPSMDNDENASAHNEEVQGSVQKDDASENLTIGKKSNAEIPKTIILSKKK